MPPFAGAEGLAAFLHAPGALAAQLAAIVASGAGTQLSVICAMVASREVELVRPSGHGGRRRRGGPATLGRWSNLPPPRAAARFGGGAAFISIGTNDLTADVLGRIQVGLAPGPAQPAATAIAGVVTRRARPVSACRSAAMRPPIPRCFRRCLRSACARKCRRGQDPGGGPLDQRGRRLSARDRGYSARDGGHQVWEARRAPMRAEFAGHGHGPQFRAAELTVTGRTGRRRRGLRRGRGDGAGRGDHGTRQVIAGASGEAARPRGLAAGTRDDLARAVVSTARAISRDLGAGRGGVVLSAL